MTAPTMTPAGWYIDPSQRHEYRYWDGKDWTPQVSDRGLIARDPELRPPASPNGALTTHPLTTPAPAPAAPAWPEPAPPQSTEPAPTVPMPPGLLGAGQEQAATSASPPAPTAAGARRRWVIPVIAVIAALALIAALVIWAPWVSKVPTVPSAVRAQSPTPTSVVVQWSPSTSGPSVDHYLILRGGTAIGSVPGTATSYQDLGLVPATGYQYRVVAVSGSHRSAPSSVLVVKTPTPPISDARLQGSWYVDSKVLTSTDPPPAVGRTATDTWKFAPQCTSGACAVAVSGNWITTLVTVTLTRAGAVYTGTAHPSIFTCGPSNIPMRDTLTIKITVGGASIQNQMWTATSWTGTMKEDVQYTPTSADKGCPASSVTASLTASP